MIWTLCAPILSDESGKQNDDFPFGERPRPHWRVVQIRSQAFQAQYGHSTDAVVLLDYRDPKESTILVARGNPMTRFVIGHGLNVGYLAFWGRHKRSLGDAGAGFACRNGFCYLVAVMCDLRLILSVVLLPLALFGAAVLFALFLYWQELLPQKYQRSVRAGVRVYRAEMTKQEGKPAR
jgi:hypothetical protein